MSGLGDDFRDMRELPAGDEAFEAILSGSISVDLAPQDQALVDLVEHIRGQARQVPRASPALAALFAAGPEPDMAGLALVVADPPPSPISTSPRLCRTGTRVATRVAALSVTLKLALGASVAVAAVGGAGAAGVLPDPMHGVVNRAAPWLVGDRHTDVDPAEADALPAGVEQGDVEPAGVEQSDVEPAGDAQGGLEQRGVEPAGAAHGGARPGEQEVSVPAAAGPPGGDAEDGDAPERSAGTPGAGRPEATTDAPVSRDDRGGDYGVPGVGGHGVADEAREADASDGTEEPGIGGPQASEQGPSDEVGPPAGVGVPEEVGPSAGVGVPEDVGPPPGVGVPEEVGPPEQAGSPSQSASPGD